MAVNIIDNSTPPIIMQETQITLSDEKLKSILLKTYEAAQRDANAIHCYKIWGVLFSISCTLLLSLLTSSFRSFGPISAEIITKVAWIITVICFLLGVVFLFISISKKNNTNTIARDKAINEIFDGYCFGKK